MQNKAQICINNEMILETVKELDEGTPFLYFYSTSMGVFG